MNGIQKSFLLRGIRIGVAVVFGSAVGALAADFSGAGCLTNVAGLRLESSAAQTNLHDLQIEAVVCSASADKRNLVIQDDSGAEVVRLEAEPDVRPGQKILLAGTRCKLIRESWGVSIVSPPLVDNDGLHGPVEKSGKIFLAAGRVPVRVEWFNAAQGRALNLTWVPPDGTRKKIPNQLLFSRTAAGGWTNGIAYRYFEGSWTTLPEFENLVPVGGGMTTNVTLEVTAQHDYVGLVFNGFLQIDRAGEYNLFLEADDGARLYVGEPTLKVTVEAEGPPPALLPLKPGAALAAGEESRWTESAGELRQILEREDGVELELNSADGQLRVCVAGHPVLPPELVPESRVVVRGVGRETFRRDGSRGFGFLPVGSVADVRIEQLPPGRVSSTPLVLTSAAQIERLSRQEAEQGYPAKIRGVITCDAPELHSGSVIQDQTRGIYVYWPDTNLPAKYGPHLGEFWEMDGITKPGQFAPVIQATHMTRLGEGQLPAPVVPTWNQLLRGALDDQFVELLGVITEADTNGVTFLTHGGKIRIKPSPEIAQKLSARKNSLVRLRGCLLAVWDADTHRVKLGEVRLLSATVTPDSFGTADPFDAPPKNVDDLLLFDLSAGSFQRVKISGQVLEKRGEEFFMLNSGRGLRFVPREPVGLKAGELVEVAGIPELDGPSPVLREAVVRRTGTAPLPAPVRLRPEQISLAQNDALRVRLDAVFGGARDAGGETLLDLLAGGNYFSARLRLPAGSVPNVEPGSRVELIGVYVSLNAVRGAGHPLGAFEILLSSAADVRVVARPPWWTLRRLVAVTGALFAVLVLAALWITQLRRRVEERTVQLRQEISGRECAEQQRMVAEEKSRIARDLHDDLGASLTEIGLQADVAQRTPLAAAQATEYFGVIADKTRTMVAALDAIVWAVDPEENTLHATAEYLGGYAEEFLSASGMDRRFKIPMQFPAVTMDGHTRHGLFLAVKEALNNIVRHARATVVEFGVSFDDAKLRVEIADNGVGFDLNKTDGGHGVENLQKRLEALGGKCQIESQPGTGTKIKMILPVHK